MTDIPLRNSKVAIDLSIIPSLECNIECPFCMYDAGKDKKDILDIGKTRKFLETVHWDRVNSCGFYGGEPTINLPLYQKFIDLVPKGMKKWIITNGTWSTDFDKMEEALRFFGDNDMYVIVRGAEYHRKFQSREMLQWLKRYHPDSIRLKGADVIHPMGRAKDNGAECTRKCGSYAVPTRVGVFPNGYILFQNCDGRYPVIQTYEESFVGIMSRVQDTIRACPGINKEV